MPNKGTRPVRRPLTLDEHRALGKELVAMSERIETLWAGDKPVKDFSLHYNRAALCEFLCANGAVSPRYNKSVLSEDFRRLHKALLGLRSKLDDLVCAENRTEPGVEDIYFPRGDA